MTALRLRRVRFKDGRTIEVLRPKDEGIGKTLTRAAARAAEFAPKDMAGFALVAWNINGEVFVNYHNGQRSPVPGGGVAQYVKDVLIAETAVRWSKD